MSKSKEKQIPDNPFAAFGIMKGEFVPPKATETEDENELEQEDEVISGKDQSIIEEELPDLKEAEKLKKGDEIIQANIKKQEEIAKRKSKGESEEVSEGETEEEPENTEEGTETSIYKTLVQELYNKGIVDFDDTDEDFEDSEEGIFKIFDKSKKVGWDKRFERLPHNVKTLIDYVEKGGDPKEFMDIYYGNQSWEDFTLDNEDAYKLAISESLRLQGESQEDIDDMILEWELSGSLEKRAKPALNKLKKFEAEQKEAIVKQQEEYAASQRKAQEEFWNGFKKNLMAKDELKGFKLTPKVKENLLSFMTDVDKKTGKTGYQLAVENDQDASLLFALQAMNGFDIKKLESQVENKAAGKLSKILKNIPSDTKTKMSSGRTTKHENDDPFELFKKAKN